jgi:NitT/TauT family transport system permease protein
MWKNLIKLYMEGSMFEHIGITCIETILGFLISTILGALIAVLLWLSDFVSEVLDPYLVVLNALPKIALAPIIIFWVGNGISAIIMVAVLISIVVTILNVLNAFKEVDRDKIRLLKTFGASKFQILMHLVMPASIPALISTLKINVGLSWVGVIMGEFLVAKEGLGFLIIFGGQISQLDTVMLSIIILSVLAYIMYKLVEAAEKKVKKRLLH